MTKTEIAEIRRRLTPQNHQIACVKGCYVNGQGQIITSFTRFLQGLDREEEEKYLSIFRRALSGEQDQNLLTVDFTPTQVISSPQHQLLMALRDSALEDEEAVQAFFDAARASLTAEENSHYLILLAHDAYAVPPGGRNGTRGEQPSPEVFRYILCGVCPVKMTKPALIYDAGVNDFCSREGDWAVGAPEIGLMFPAFDDRTANIYNAVYYTRDAAAAHEGFAAAVFGAPPPVPFGVQKANFQALLENSLGEECSYEVMHSVHEQALEKIEERKADKTAQEPPRMDSREVSAILKDCGVTGEKRAAFEQAFDEEFGAAGALNAAAVSSPRQFQVKMPDVVIRVSPARSDLLETRVIDGRPYILIRADEGVEVNGVNVNILRSRA